MNRKQYITEQVKKAEKPESTSDYIDRLQGYADFAGLIPGVGDVLDIGSALVDVAQGQYGDAAFRGAAALPLVGSAIGAGKGVKRALGLASIAAPAAGGVMRALQPDDAAGDGGREEVQKAVKQNTAQLDQKAEKPEEAESDEDQSKFDVSSMFNTRLISHAPLQQFRSLQTNSFQQELDNTTDMLTESIVRRGAEAITDLMKKITGKGGKKASSETAEEAAERAAREAAEKAAKAAKPKPVRTALKYGTGAGLGSLGLLAAGIGAPALLGGMFGAGGEDAGGQPLVPGSGQQGGEASGMGAIGSVVDRLTSAYGYIPGFNPAGLAIQTLGKRVGAV
tara:strand:- start:706 stop:1716 length:1011 start_codon:yes stop_codon:yes gene_type:complete